MSFYNPYSPHPQWLSGLLGLGKDAATIAALISTMGAATPAVAGAGAAGASAGLGSAAGLGMGAGAGVGAGALGGASAAGGSGFLSQLPGMISAGQGIMGGGQQPQQNQQPRPQPTPVSFAPSSYQPTSGQSMMGLGQQPTDVNMAAILKYLGMLPKQVGQGGPNMSQFGR